MCFYPFSLLPCIKYKERGLPLEAIFTVPYSSCTGPSLLLLLFSHVRFLSCVKVWGKKGNTGPRSNCGQNVLVSDHSFIPIAGRMYGVSRL